METSPVTCRTLEEFYHIDCHTFEKQYKEVLSGYRNWEQLSHADEWMLFPENIGPHLAIDETSLSNGELYTFVTNRDACTRECSLVAVVAGTKSEDVIAVLQRIDEESRYAVKEGLSGNFWLVSFKISYLCLPLFHETRTTPSCHPSGCAYRQL